MATLLDKTELETPPESRQLLGPSASQRYRIVATLGHGATATVFQAHDRVLGTQVALKLMHQMGADARLNLKREFRTARDLVHPNLVRLYDLVVDGHDSFFTMELVAGASIRRLSPEKGGLADGAKIVEICGALLQLVHGVTALHEARVIHRDIKPSNVLLEGSGRVVLVDFGFASPVKDEEGSEDHALIGTLPFMAPERFWGAQPTPASDWYSVGVLAAELLVGAPIFVGALRDLLRQKDRPPTTLRDRVPSLPPVLDQLICGLLQREDGQRPGPAEILETLSTLASSAAPSTGAHVGASPFVGRVDELVRLRQLINGSTNATLIRVQGPSGVGKSALVQEALSRLPKHVHVFRGRCHPRERVPFAALDEVMDQLSRHLGRLPAHERLDITPTHAGALVTLFPVLERALVAEEDGPLPSASDAANAPAADPHERRMQAASALRDLWHAVATRWTTVVWIDDIQWADRDGTLLLQELLSAPNPAVMHWIFCERTTATPTTATMPHQQVVWKDSPIQQVEMLLEGLADAEAGRLAQFMGLDESLVPKVVAEARGSPPFIAELARYMRADVLPVTKSSLAAIIGARVAGLSSPARRVLEYVSLAAEPLSAGDLQALMGAEAAMDGLPLVEKARLVRAAPGQEPTLDHAFEPFHDRIRETVVAGLDAKESSRLHLDLAQRFEGLGRSAACLAFHYRAAGDPRALQQTLAAAREAAKALAFGDAADLLRVAVELQPPPVPSEFHAEWADLLLAAGQCSLAADQYLNAATNAAREGQDESLVRRYKRQSGEQYLYGGKIQEGRELLDSTLRSYGIRIPRLPFLSAVVGRLRFLIRRNLTPRRRTQREDAARARAERIDTLCNVAKGTVMVEHVLGDAFVLRALQEALELGDPQRLAWSLALEAASEANIGGLLRHRPGRLIEQAFQLAGPAADPPTDGWLRLCRATVAYFQGRWRDASHDLEGAIRTFRTRCVGATYEFATANIFLLAALAFQGRFREVGILLPDLAQWARERGNAYAGAMFGSGNSVYWYLANDDPSRAMADADRGLANWKAPGFTSQNFHLFLTYANALLYAGAPWDAWRRIVSVWPDLRRSHFLDLECIGLQLRELRARVALSAAASESVPSDLSRWTRERLLRTALADAKTIRRSSLPHAAATAGVIEAGVAAAKGDRPTAASLLAGSISGFEVAGMLHLRACASLALSTLIETEPPSPTGAMDERRRQATAALEEMGVKAPKAFQKFLVPV